MNVYTFNDHLHNYAIWTAARATQRGFTTTKNIKSAIDASGLKELIYSKEKKENITIEQFDKLHREITNKIIKCLHDLGIPVKYGQAAKIIAIYLKTAIIIRDSGLSNISRIAHPPIDNILLTHLHKDYPDVVPDGIKWTKIDEKEYFELIDKLRTLDFDYFWELEKYWSPVQKE